MSKRVKAINIISGIVWVVGGFEGLLWESTHNYHPSTFYWINITVGWIIWFLFSVLITVSVGMDIVAPPAKGKQ